MSAMRDIQDCGYSYELSNLIMKCVHKMPIQRLTFGHFLKEIANIKRKCGGS